MLKNVLLKTVLHAFLLKSKLLFLVSKNSELKAKFLFKNKATKSNKNVPSLGSNGSIKYIPEGPPPGQLRSGMIFLCEIPYPRGQIIVKFP